MKRMLLLVLFILLVPTYSFATVIYEFTAYTEGNGLRYPTPKSFTLTVSDYLTSDSSYTPGDSYLTSSDYNSVTLWVDAYGFTGIPSQAISPQDSTGTPYYYFSPDSFITNGLHTSIIFGENQYAELTVRGNGTPAVPEPATMALFGLGLLGIAGVSRKK